MAEKIIGDASGVLGEWSHESNFADLFWSYRLLLQRAPEYSDKATYKRRCADTPCRTWPSLSEGNGFRYWFNIRGGPIAHNLAKGCYEVKVTGFVSQFVKPRMSCLDVSANLGYFSVLMGRLAGSEGRAVRATCIFARMS